MSGISKLTCDICSPCFWFLVFLYKNKGGGGEEGGKGVIGSGEFDFGSCE